MSQQPHQPSDRDTDPFRPPAVPCEVHCIHCGQSYESWQIEWRELPDNEALSGTWCCPTPGCDGIGFGFDILPTDPDWTDEHGDKMWCCDEDDEEELSFTDQDEDEATFLPDKSVDTFDANTLWVDWSKSKPKPHGNTPQPPFGKPFNEDDIPF